MQIEVNRLRWLMLVMIMLAAPAGAGEYSSYSGQELFKRFCSSCHGVSGQGDGPVSDSVSVMVPDLTKLARRNGGEIDQARLREIIDGRAAVATHGSRYMPVWGYEFWVEEGGDVEAEAEVRTIVGKLVAYIASLQT